MKTPSRKILSVVLAVAVLASLLATSVFAGQRAVGVGAVTAAQSTMRTGPESDAAELAQLTAGTDVAVLGQSGDWYHINYNDQYGYLPVSELEVSPTADDLETTGSVTAGTAVVRSAPELTAAGIGSADRYVSLEVTGFESGWFRVIFGEKEGYVRSDEVTLNGAPIRVDDPMTEEQIAAETSLEDDPVEQDSQLAIINGSGVNLRSGPDTGYDRVATASYGEKCYIVGLNQGWYKVLYNSQTCYIRSDFLTLTEIPYENQASTNTPQYFRHGQAIGTLPSSSAGVAAVGTSGPVSSTYTGSATGEQILAKAASYLGTPYVYGGASPSGFDCSGFVYYVYGTFGISVGRTPASQYSAGTPVDKASLQAGDIVLFAGTAGSGITHAGIYAGNGQFIHSPNSRSTVSYSDLTSGYWSEHFYCGIRVV